MHITYKKLLRSEPRGRLSAVETLFGWLLRPRFYIYYFEILPERVGFLEVGDEVLFVGGTQLLVTEENPDSSIVLRTKELLKEAPSLGIEMLVISRACDHNKNN